MSARRFTDKPDLNPQAVIGLAPDHPAMVENRTLFPTTAVTVTADTPDRLLIEGKNNRKIGATVEKGQFKGYGIYCLSLEERATCPMDCSMRSACFGNSMHYARRHRIEDSEVFFDRLALEIAQLLDDEPHGLSIRLHVLGDFPSVEYVSFWKEVLDEYPNVMCWGYTHRSAISWGGDEIGDAIQSVKDAYPDRFRIRWSSDVSRADGAIVIDHVPTGPRTDNRDLVCPAQTDATACCATCGLCWEAPRECIAFVKHGRVSGEAEVATVMREAKTVQAPKNLLDNSTAADESETRSIRAISTFGLSPARIEMERPTFVEVDPTTLIVETKYQRDLSAKSLALIKRVVERFDWAKFKPPVCVKANDGYFVIDGQHTAIAAASHPDIETIPIMVVDAASLEARAASFVAHNRDRVAMSPYQVFHGEVASGDPEAVALNKVIVEAGGTVPRNPIGKRDCKIGTVTAISAVQSIHSQRGPAAVRKVIAAAVEGRARPINATVIWALDILFSQPQYEGVSQHDIVTALIARADLDQAAARFGAETNQGRFNAAAVILYRAACALSGRKVA